MKLNAELTAVEGCWQIGKTTLLKFLSNYKYGVVPEPIPTEEDRAKNDLDYWYAEMHLRNIEIASKMSGVSVIERTLASDLAFMKTISSGSKEKDSKLTQIVKNAQKSGLLNNVTEVVFLRVDPKTYMEHRVEQIEDQSIVPLLTAANSPFEEFQHNLEYFISILFPHAAIADVLSYGKEGFESKAEILQKVNKQIKGTL